MKSLLPAWNLESEDPKPSTNKASIVKTLPLYFPWDIDVAKLAGCPYTAISILTGEDPFILRRTYKNQSGLSPLVMSNHFVQLGFDVQEITKDYLYELLSQGKLITNAHVILASVRMTYEESSWVVLHGGIMWHNYTATNTSFATSLSFPMEYGYKLYIPEWKDCGIERIKLKKFPVFEDVDVEDQI